MVRQYRGYTIVDKPRSELDASDSTQLGVVVFEGDSDETFGEFDTPGDAFHAIDLRYEQLTES